MFHCSIIVEVVAKHDAKRSVLINPSLYALLACTVWNEAQGDKIASRSIRKRKKLTAPQVSDMLVKQII